MPFRRIARQDWLASIARLEEQLPRLTDDEVAVELMGIVASLHDGHTSLSPAFDAWFPLRFYEFSDGLYITAADKSLASLAGARVERVGDRSAAEAMMAAKRVFASENEFAARESAVLLSSPRVTHALKINSQPDTLPLDLKLRDGTRTHVDVASIKSKPGFDWRFAGEMYGPAGLDFVTAFNRPSEQLRDPDANPDLPLHMRGRRAYWFSWLATSAACYVQINGMANRSNYTNESFEQFIDRLFTFCDAHPVSRLVIDLRYNAGGNGRLVKGIIHKLIKRDDTINRPGHLFVITGGKTFSAAADFVLALREDTEVMVAGEPAGAGFNAAGDPDDLTLPFSGMSLSVSTNYHVSANFRDQSRWIPVQLPAQMSGLDYFAGRDPAMDAVLAPDAAATIIGTLKTSGGDAATKLYEKRKALFGSLAWWEPFERIAMNAAGYALLESGKVADAVAAMAMNADRFPDTWETWDSLAEVEMAAGKNAVAIEHYERALRLSPDNWNAGAERKAMEKMKRAAR